MLLSAGLTLSVYLKKMRTIRLIPTKYTPPTKYGKERAMRGKDVEVGRPDPDHGFSQIRWIRESIS